MNKNLISTFKETFKVDIPKGVFYYPCCGRDTYEPFMLFRDTIKEFHFCDCNKVILPAMECNKSALNHELMKKDMNNYIPVSIIKDVKQKANNYKFDVGEYVKRISSCDFGSILIRNSGSKEKWLKADGSIIQIITHIADALITLINLKNISIFYYRGDSIGEGGSGQLWFGKDIFNILLNKLVPGAIVLTDGSNPNPCELYVPWQPLFNREINSLNYNFQYRGRQFKYIGVCDYRRNNTKAWQVI